jgi:hypothetical protein
MEISNCKSVIKVIMLLLHQTFPNPKAGLGYLGESSKGRNESERGDKAQLPTSPCKQFPFAWVEMALSVRTLYIMLYKFRRQKRKQTFKHIVCFFAFSPQGVLWF